MNRVSSYLITSLAVFVIGSAHLGASSRQGNFAPDTIVFRDGSMLRGLIVRSTADTVTLQQEFHERTIPKKWILRIRDEADSGPYFADSKRKGYLPPWRTIANDLRTHDAVRKLEQIPATVRKDGPLRDVPYMAFRVNGEVELNIYGDPNDPCAIEMGIYGRHGRNEELRRSIRTFLAGFLFSKEEIGTLYALESGSKSVGQMQFQIDHRQGPDRERGWWITMFNPGRLDDVRMHKADYARLTAPLEAVQDAEGLKGLQGVRNVSHRGEAQRDEARVFLRGFYRDDEGVFRLP
jgi:hypothetical protein